MAHSLSIQFEFWADPAIERSVGGTGVYALLDRCVDHFSADADERNDDDAVNALTDLRYDQDEKNLCFTLVRARIAVFGPQRSRRRRRGTLPANGSAVRHHRILC